MSATQKKNEAHKIVTLSRAFHSGDYEKVLRGGRAALKKWPKSASINHLCGIASMRIGNAQNAEAFLSKAVKLEGCKGRAAHDFGVVLLKNKSFDKAEEIFLSRFEGNPKDAECANALASLYRQKLSYQKALKYYGISAQLEPKNVAASRGIASCLEEMGLYSEAVKTCHILKQIDPTNVEHSLKLASNLLNVGQHEVALEELEEALVAWPNESGDIICMQAKIYSAMGDFETAFAKYKQALQLSPDSERLMMEYAARFGAKDPFLVEQLRRLVKTKKGSSSFRVHLALGRIEKDCGNFEASHAAFLRANSLKKMQIGECMNTERRVFNNTKLQYLSLPKIENHEDTGPVPIFITGMPRSGTTLMESILARHTKVTPLGECEAMPKIIHFGLIAKQGLQAVQRTYLDTEAADVNTEFCTDKNPLNFRFLGQMVNAFPQAKFVHMNRDPRAIAWSLYTTSLSVPGYSFTYDPDDLVEYYNIYDDLMSFWSERLGDRIINVDYQKLTATPEVEIPALLEKLKLPFEEACLAPEKGDHTIKTASVMQVRKPIYKGSSDAWRKYEPYAGHWLNRLVNDDGSMPWESWT